MVDPQLGSQLAGCQGSGVACCRVGLGVFHADFVSGHFFTIEILHRRLGVAGFRHFDKTKAFGTSGFLVDDQGAGLHGAKGREHCP